MNLKSTFAYLVSSMAIAISFAPVAQSAEVSGLTGTILGLVSSAKTGNTLQGAVVEIPALNRQVITDNSGQFTLSGLPQGPVDLIVSYIGLREEKRTVLVAAAGQAPVSFRLNSADVITMDKFNVASEREGNSLAVSSQRNAVNLKNVVAMDAFGNLPNMGVADLASRLPGVAPEFDAEGPPSRVSIRGLPTSMTTTTVDGDPVFRGNGVRWASMYGMSASTYEQIELIKGRTPEESANSLGGGLNLKTRSPLSMTEKRRTTYNVAVRWAPPFFEHAYERRQHPLHPQFNLSHQEAYSVLGGERNLGVGINLHYSENVNSGNLDTYIYQNTTASPAFINDYRTTTQQNNRKIKTFDIRMEYRLSASSKFFFGSTINQGNEPFNDLNSIRFFTGSTIATIGANGQPTGTGTIMPGFTESRTQVRAQPASQAAITSSHSSFIATSPTVNFGAEHKFDRWDLDYRLAHTQMHIDRGINQRPDGAGGTLTYSAPNIGWIIDRSDSTKPQFTQTEGRSVYDIASYNTGVQHTIRDEIEQTWAGNARFNAAYRLPTAVTVTWKSGLAFQSLQNNITSQGNAQWNRVPTAAPLPNVSIYRTVFEERQGAGLFPAGSARVTYTQLKDTSLWAEDLNYREVQKLSRKKEVHEEIYAGYTMLRMKMDRLDVIAGVRTERTDDSGEANVRIKPATVAQIPDPVARARHDWTNLVKNEGSYTRSFPSLHVNYDITPNFKARASWSTSFGRPDFASMAPTATINDTAQTVTISNPALGPQYAKNIDLSLYYYFKPAGYFSIGYFHKKITDYILTADIGFVATGASNGYLGDYAGYVLRSTTNAGSAEVTGWEFDYRQQFTFLPGLLKGLELAGNFTTLKTEGNFGGAAVTKDTEVAGFTPQTANASLSYNYDRYGVRMNFAYQSNFLRNFSALPEGRTYLRQQKTVDFSLFYRWRQDVTFSVDLNNVTGARRAAYQYIPGRIREMYVPGQTLSFRVGGRF